MAVKSVPASDNYFAVLFCCFDFSDSIIIVVTEKHVSYQLWLRCL